MNKILDWRDYVKFSDTFVETGSCWGRTIQYALDAGFKRIKSVEFYDSCYDSCRAKFSGNDSVELFKGMSVDVLPEMLKDVDKPAVFWLDAHPSGEGTGGYDELVKEGRSSEFAQHNILCRELEIIFGHRDDHIILIDDMNWEHREKEYEDIILAKNIDYEFFMINEQFTPEIFFENKILVAIPKKWMQ